MLLGGEHLMGRVLELSLSSRTLDPELLVAFLRVMACQVPLSAASSSCSPRALGPYFFKIAISWVI